MIRGGHNVMMKVLHHFSFFVFNISGHHPFSSRDRQNFKNTVFCYKIMARVVCIMQEDQVDLLKTGQKTGGQDEYCEHDIRVSS